MELLSPSDTSLTQRALQDVQRLPRRLRILWWTECPHDAERLRAWFEGAGRIPDVTIQFIHDGDEARCALHETKPNVMFLGWDQYGAPYYDSHMTFDLMHALALSHVISVAATEPRNFNEFGGPVDYVFPKPWKMEELREFIEFLRMGDSAGPAQECWIPPFEWMRRRRES